MSAVERSALIAIPLVVAVIAAGATLGRDDANWQRLASFPRERREELLEKLKEFHALDRATQSAVRELDAQLGALPPEERASYHAVLRRYHLWLDGLTEAQRDQIGSQPPNSRMDVVRRITSEQAARPANTSPTVLRYSDFGDYSPFELAEQVLIWRAANPAQKAELARLDEAPRNFRLQRLQTELGVKEISRPMRIDEAATIKRAMKRGLSTFLSFKKIDERLKETKARERMIDHLWFMDSPPKRVDTDNLVRFARSLPPWIRALSDPLPPDEARRRLTVIYRLLYPSPAEYVEAKPAAPTRPEPAPTAPVKPAPSTAPF